MLPSDSPEHIYKSAYRSFFIMCIRYCGDREVAKEIFNDALLNYFHYAEENRVNEKGRYSLIKKMLVNKCIDYLRTRTKKQLTPKALTEYPMNDGELNLMKEEMFELIQTFAPQTRLIFNLYVFEGWSHKEISKELNISIHTSSWHVSQGKQQILQLFKVTN